MNFMQLLNSLDEFLYMVMSWLVFYPLTLWRVVRHPWRMMDYADKELSDPAEDRFTDAISPPLFLLISILLAHGIELAVVGDSPLIADTRRLARLIDSDTSLIVMRLIIFSMFPMLMAVQLARKQAGRLTRKSLQLPFYSQCYVAGPFALVASLAATLTQYPSDAARLASVPLLAAAIIWYLVVQTRWFATKLPASLFVGSFHAAITMAAGLAILTIVLPLFA